MSGLSPEVQALKDEGNKNFRVAEYLKAAASYTKALKQAERDGSEQRELAPIYSNRSASFLRLSKVGQALSDADRCIELRPDWDKAYFRKATALEAQNDDEAALVQFEEALRVATEDQSGMLEQKIRLCKQRVARAKREENHHPKKAHGEKEVAGKVRDKGSGFKFAGAAEQAQKKMKTLVKDTVAAAPDEKQQPKAPAPAAGKGTDKSTEAEAQKKAAEEKASAAAKAAAEKEAAEEKAAAAAKAAAEKKAAEEKAAAAAKAAAEKKAAEEKAAAAAKAAAEKKAAEEKAAAEQAAAAAAKALADETAAKKAALANRRAKAAAAKKAEEEAAAAVAKYAPNKMPRPEAKKSPRPSKKSEPMPVWLPVAVLGGAGALIFAAIAIGGTRSRNRA